MEANGDGTGKQLLLRARGKSGYQTESRAGPELAAFSLRDNQRFPGHTVAPRQVTRKINADSGLASLLFHAPPPPAAGTGTRGAELASSLVPYYEMSTDLVQTNPSC